jgi:hypothetical protein
LFTYEDDDDDDDDDEEDDDTDESTSGDAALVSGLIEKSKGVASWATSFLKDAALSCP